MRGATWALESLLSSLGSQEEEKSSISLPTLFHKSNSYAGIPPVWLTWCLPSFCVFVLAVT